MMTITSFSFWLFLLAAVPVYYMFPFKRFQWVLLVVYSGYFFVTVSGLPMILYLLYGVAVTWCGALLLHRIRNEKKKRAVLAVVLTLTIGELACLKYVSLAVNTTRIIAGALGREFSYQFAAIAAPIGISYYTLSMIGYVLDVYWEKYEPQGNFLKYLLFAIYFPQLVSGPITRYEQMGSQLYAGRTFDHVRVLYGIQRMLWGVFKKLVVADRAAIFVSAVYGNHATYNGYYILAAILLFALQLYADFSGCMDIICGVSECFGVSLPENFNVPFSSQTVEEFWRRWHITMGIWFKEYLLYPLLKTRAIQKMKKGLKRRFGKNAGKSIPTYMGLAVVWLAIGIWHGGDYKYIVASGLLPGFYLITGQICKPLFDRISSALRIRTDVCSWRMFRAVRTFLCMCTSWVFVRSAGFLDGLNVWKHLFAGGNPEIFFDGSLYTLGLTWQDFNVLYIGVLLMAAVGAAHKRGLPIREKIREQNMAAQWLVMMAALFAVIILGIYGPAYNASNFIYENF